MPALFTTSAEFAPTFYFSEILPLSGMSLHLAIFETPRPDMP